MSNVIIFPVRSLPSVDTRTDHGQIRLDMHDTRDVALPLDRGLADTLDAWRLRGVAAGHSDRTITARLGTIRRLAAAVDPLAASEDDLIEWLASLPLARSSKATYRSHLAAFYGFLVESGQRSDNPATRLPSAKAPRGVPHPLTPAEVERVLAACADPRAKRTRAYVILAAYAGLRAHEIAKVRGEDFRGDEIAVTGKGGVSSTVPMPPIIRRLADEYPASGYWFPAETEAGHMHRVSVSIAVQRAFRRAGVVAVPHALRHHFCTQVLRASGGDLRTTQRLARHASPATTAIYTQVIDETARRAVMGVPGAA